MTPRPRQAIANLPLGPSVEPWVKPVSQTETSQNATGVDAEPEVKDPSARGQLGRLKRKLVDVGQEGFAGSPPRLVTLATLSAVLASV